MAELNLKKKNDDNNNSNNNNSKLYYLSVYAMHPTKKNSTVDFKVVLGFTLMIRNTQGKGKKISDFQKGTSIVTFFIGGVCWDQVL